MLGKVIVHGADREAARRALVAALDDTAILGLTTNTGFLRALVACDEFRDATIDTAWLDHRRRSTARPTPTWPGVFAAWIDARCSRDRHRHRAPVRSADGWRLGGRPGARVVELDRAGAPSTGRRRARVDGVAGAPGLGRRRTSSCSTSTAAATRAVVNVHRHVVEVAHPGHRHVFERPDVFADHGPARRRRHAHRADARHGARRPRRRGPGRSAGARCSA